MNNIEVINVFDAMLSGVVKSAQITESNFTIWREELNDDDLAYFDKLMAGAIVTGDQLTYFGKTKRIFYNAYNTILNEPTWKSKQKKQWTTYVMQKFKSIDNFNKYIKQNHETIISDVSMTGISFINEIDNFPLMISFYDKLNPKVYVRMCRNNNKVALLCSLNDYNAKKMIFTYLKLNARLDCLRGVKSEQKVYDALMEEMANGYHKYNFLPRQLSNDYNEYCLAYIPLNYTAKGKIPAWNEFLSLIENNTMKSQLMAWIYGLLVANDYNRTVLWLEGPAESGKTTVVNAIATYLATFNPSLIGTLSKTEDRFSLTAVVNARLVIYSDVKDNDFFRRRDVLTLTGKDIVYYEEKGKNPETKSIFGKIFVTSNYPPNLNKSHDFETSRLLHIKINDAKAENMRKSHKMSKNEFSLSLLREMPFFLEKCKTQYNKKIIK